MSIRVSKKLHPKKDRTVMKMYSYSSLSGDYHKFLPEVKYWTCNSFLFTKKKHVRHNNASLVTYCLLSLLQAYTVDTMIKSNLLNNKLFNKHFLNFLSPNGTLKKEFPELYESILLHESKVYNDNLHNPASTFIRKISTTLDSVQDLYNNSL